MDFKINRKEELYFAIMSLISIVAYGFIIFQPAIIFQKAMVGYFGLVLVFLAINFIGSLLFIGHLKGNAIKVNKNQFPDIFEILESHSKKLGLSKTPDMYILQGNGVLNAFATRFLKDFVILHSNVLEVAYQEGKDAVSFIIGHELGHIKRNHTRFFKTLLLLPAKLIPFLSNAYSRGCEYTCDNIGYNLCPEGSLKGILILATGKHLHKKINIDELLLNIESEKCLTLTFAEIFSTHPALINRIEVIYKLNRDNLTENKFFTSPTINIKQSEINQ